MFSSGVATYSAVARGSVKAFSRPNCLNIKSKVPLKREDICQLIEKDGFSLKKVVGIAELKGSSMDIACQTRQNALELYEKLRMHEKIGITRLYESDKTYVALSWVPIPFPDLLIQQRLEKDYGKVLKILHKKDKNGLRTGTRIITMNTSDLEKNPIPSYLFVEGYEFLATYNGQVATCRYCGQPNHKQLDCPQRLQDYPEPEEASTGSRKVIQHPSTHSQVEESRVKESLVKPKTPQEEELQTNDTYDDNNDIGIFNARKREREENSPELPKSKIINLSEKNTQNAECPACNSTVHFSKKKSKTIFCWACSATFCLTTTCCTNELFLMPKDALLGCCPACNKNMRKLPCCNKYSVETLTEQNTYQCLNCEKCSTLCPCNTINPIPKSSMSKACMNNTCDYKIIHCTCGKIVCERITPDNKFKCICGYEYEWDIDIGVKI